MVLTFEQAQAMQLYSQLNDALLFSDIEIAAAEAPPTDPTSAYTTTSDKYFPQ